MVLTCLTSVTGGPGKVLDLCEAVGVPNVILPNFMQNSIRLYGRQVNDESSSIGSGLSTPATAQTVTSTQDWGLPASTGTVTLLSDPNTPFTVVYVWLEGASITTLVSTTTVAPWESPFTSTVTAKDSPIATRVIGVPYTASPTSATPTSSSTVTQTSSATPAPSGLSLGVKVGLGVSLPLAIVGIAIGIFIYLRKRKSPRHDIVEPQETHDGGLPEHVSDISKVDLSKFPQDPNGFRQVHELGHDEESDMTRRVVHELSNETASRHEMNAGDTPGGGTLADTARGDGSTASTAVSKSHTGRQGVPPVTRSAHTEQSTHPSPNHNTLNMEVNEEVRAMQQEMAHIQARKEQLQRLQALEAREEELKKTIEQKRGRGEL